MEDRNLVIACDLGKYVDRTAVCILEHIDLAAYVDFPGPHEGHIGENCDCHWQITGHKYEVVALRRWPLLSSYTRVVREIGAMMRESKIEDAQVVVDATGVGRDIFNLFANAWREGLLGKYPPLPYVIAGSGASEGPDDKRGYFRITKTDLVGRLIGILEGRNLTIPDMPDAEHLRRETENFRRGISKRGLATFAASGTAEHDDLISALLMAAWQKNYYSAPPRRVMAPEAPEIAAKA